MATTTAGTAVAVSKNILQDIMEAKKKLASMVNDTNYMVITLSYDKKLVLSFEDGMKLMASLTKAEVLDQPYSKPVRILPIQQDTIETNLMSVAEYQKIKLAGLLNVDPKDLPDLMKDHP